MSKVTLDVDWNIGPAERTVDIVQCSRNVTLNPHKHNILSGPRHVGESDSPAGK